MHGLTVDTQSEHVKYSNDFKLDPSCCSYKQAVIKNKTKQTNKQTKKKKKKEKERAFVDMCKHMYVCVCE